MSAAIFVAAVLLWPAHGHGAASEQPNIIFVFTDDHASHAISAYGSEINQTPNIDRLAQEGMLFRNCFVENSICAPSRAAILTGKLSHRNGVINNRVTFDGSQQTFPKLLQQAGYQTAITGKWHLKSEPTGFDYWHILQGQGPYYNPVMVTPDGKISHTGYTTEIITDVTLDWLKNRRAQDKPFMLMYQHKAPHRNWAPGPDYLTQYDDQTIPEPDTLFDDYSGRASPARHQEMTIERHLNSRDLKLVPPSNLTEEQLAKWEAAYGPKNRAFRDADLEGKELVRWKYQRYIKDYLRSVDAVDDNLGRLLDYLDQSGLAENTVVIYSSDQGFYLGDHGWFDKRWMYEESLRMPLIVRWPGVTPPGSENRDLVQNIDFAETFLDMAGVKLPDTMQGRSLVPLLKGQTPQDWRDSIYYHYYEYPAVHMVQRHYGVRTDRYKLIHYYLVDEWELFDLKKDPDEMNSRYDDPEYADVVNRLKGDIERLQAKYKVNQFDEPGIPPDPKEVQLKQMLLYDFAAAEDNRIQDRSGEGHHGQLENGRIVSSRHGRALQLQGNGSVQLNPAPDSLNPWNRPLTVGAWCRPENGNGVIVAQGGESLGYALYLKGNRPHFAIRSQGNLYITYAEDKISNGEWGHVAGVLDADGQIRVYVNGRPSGSPAKSSFIARKPADGLSVGADIGSRVSNYDNPTHWNGYLDDVRIYWGKLEPDPLRQWAGQTSNN